MTQLAEVVAKSIGRCASDIDIIKKLTEGGSYRVFQALLKDGTKLIARIPYPCTIPRKYGVASEVATMEFLRSFGIPIPIVLGWSATADNPLGCEYIVMERAEGRPLFDTWFSMTFKERMKIIPKIVDIERKLFDIKFPGYGSIYFQDSLRDDVYRIPISTNNDTSTYCLGPSSEYLWWYQKREFYNADRGPCSSSPSFVFCQGF